MKSREAEMNKLHAVLKNSTAGGIIRIQHWKNAQL